MLKVVSSHVEFINSHCSTQSNFQSANSRSHARFSSPVTIWTGLFALLTATAVPAAAQGAQSGNGDKPSINAIRLEQDESVNLNGRLDEEFWRRGTAASGFRQENPDEGATATEETEVYVVYDADNLYIGAFLHDSDPQGIIAYQKERDAMLMTDDRFMWILDTFLDGRTGYFFEINPAGLMGDGLLGGGGDAAAVAVVVVVEACSADSASTSRGMGYGKPESIEMVMGGLRRFEFPSVRSTSTLTGIPGASTSTAQYAASKKNPDGLDFGVRKNSLGRCTPDIWPVFGTCLKASGSRRFRMPWQAGHILRTTTIRPSTRMTRA